MIDWQSINLADLAFDVQVEDIQEVGHTFVFPVAVKLKDGTPAFTQPVSLRADFYRELKKTPDWETALMQILKARVREEVHRRKKQNSVSIHDRLRLMNANDRSLQ
ncbi:hypothetical protein [Nitrospina watsonii]|uniref:Uncharacterized protein n=1 Tax=Nitrospina watsonii TaxID=1323948 RepID=A0ABM9HI54_9BACT|nr:hypothetical protein [Nitrospina watsonii]CAI2719741.1 conserved protein of unknown function [Nitrospina watsonii]